MYAVDVKEKTLTRQIIFSVTLLTDSTVQLLLLRGKLHFTKVSLEDFTKKRYWGLKSDSAHGIRCKQGNGCVTPPSGKWLI